MPDVFKKTVFWWVISLFGFGLLTICYILAWQGKISYGLFWVGIGVSCFSLLFVMLLSKDKRHILFALFILGLVIYSLQIYRSPDYFINRDEMVHYQGYASLIEKGNLRFNHTTFPIIKDYPGLEFLVASTFFTTALKPIFSGKILIGFIHSMLLIVLWIYFSKLGLSDNIASIGTFLYALNPRYTQFDSMVSYESVGIFFVILLLFLIKKMIDRRVMTFSVLAIIALFALVITHHLSSYMFLTYGLILLVIQYTLVRLKNEEPKKNLSTFIVLAGVFVFGWLIYIAAGAISYLTLGFKDRILAILQLSIFGGEGARAMFMGSPVPPYESFILRFLYPPVLLFFCLYGGYLLLVKKIFHLESLRISLFFFGPVLFLASWLLVPTTSGSELAYRSWAFLFVGVAFTIAVAFKSMKEEKNFIFQFVLSGALIIMLFSGFSLARNEAVRFPVSRFVDNESFYTLQAFRAADWLSSKDSKGLKLLGTWPQRDVMGSYGAQYVDSAQAARFIVKDEVDFNTWQHYNYLAVDNRVTELIYSMPKSYFGIKLPEPYADVGHVKPLPVYLLQKYNYCPAMLKVYDNGPILLYRNIF